MPWRIIDADAFMSGEDTGIRFKLGDELYPVINVEILSDYMAFIAHLEKVGVDGTKIDASAIAKLMERPYELIHRAVPACSMDKLKTVAPQKAIVLAGMLARQLLSATIGVEQKSPGRLGGIEESSKETSEAEAAEKEET